MWNEINNEKDLVSFMKKINYFHDSCLKEMKYVSGAYVDENLSMYPINDRRVLKMVIQRQFDELPVIEMEFTGLRFLKLFPRDENYTCEILEATMLLKNDYVYWCDCGGLSELDMENYGGNIICASKFRWRSINDCLGEKDIFNR